MPSPRLLLSAATHHPRHSIVAALASALNQCGWVVGFYQFSNSAVAVHFELPPSSLTRLSETLQALPLQFSSESVSVLRSVATSDPAAFPDPVPGSINVTFFHCDPDLRLPVPAVPG